MKTKKCQARMNIRVGYQIPYSQAKIDNTHLNRLKRRLAANHYQQELKFNHESETENNKRLGV